MVVACGELRRHPSLPRPRARCAALRALKLGYDVVMSKWGWGFVIASAALGCGGASLVLKSPIEERCVEAGLRGCPALAEGITSYVDGDKDEAQRQIAKAGASNSPAEIKDFADKLRALKDLPGAAEYVAPLLEVANMLVASSGEGGEDQPKPRVRDHGERGERGQRAERGERGGRVPRTPVSAEGTRSGPAVTARWEYLVETIQRDDASDRLGSLGKKGWELVSAAPETGGILCVLKRPAMD